MTTQTPHIYSALAQCVTDIGLLGIDKAKQNLFQKFNYRSIDQVLAAFNKVFSKNQVFMVHRVLDTKLECCGKDAKGSNVWFLQLTLEVTFFSGVDGSTLPYASTIIGGNDGKDVTKLTGQLTSYLLKELLFKQFLVPSEGAEDIDGRDESGRPRAVVEGLETNKLGVRWTEPPFADGEEAVISWATTLTGKTVEEVTKILQDTPVDAKGKKGNNFKHAIKKLWETAN